MKSAIALPPSHEGMRRLKPGDALLIAGKGHETGQIVKGVTIPFSDFDVARAALEGSGWNPWLIRA